MARRIRRSTRVAAPPLKEVSAGDKFEGIDSSNEMDSLGRLGQSNSDADGKDGFPADLDAALLAKLNFAKASIYFTNARDGLNLRSGPGTDFPVIRSIPLGTRVHLIKREGRWGLIDERGDGATDGFVHLAFLNEGPSVDVGTGVFSTADQVRTFWAERNPRHARLYDRNGKAMVDPRLLQASATAITKLEDQNPNYRIEMYGPNGGLRSGGRTRNHTAQPGTGRGAAMDIVIIDRGTGRMLTNHPGREHQNQGTVGQNAPAYQEYYNEVVRAGSQLYSRFEEMARFGGYFASGDNAMDTMHIDMRGLEVPMAGGSLRGGFTRGQMRRWDIPKNAPYS